MIKKPRPKPKPRVVTNSTFIGVIVAKEKKQDAKKVEKFNMDASIVDVNK